MWYRLYAAARRLLPASWQENLGAAAWLAPLRDRLLRPGRRERLASGEVAFEGRRFHFEAPWRIYETAHRRGIERRISRWVLGRLAPGAVALDVGASYGWLTLLMGVAASPGGKVLACEADPDIAAVVRSSVDRNGLAPIVEVLAGRVGKAEHEITVDALVESRGWTRLDLLKIDVDGADLAVLQGARRTLERLRPWVVVETNDAGPALYALLTDAGYRVFDMDHQKMVGSPAGVEWPANLFAIPVAGVSR